MKLTNSVRRLLAALAVAGVLAALSIPIRGQAGASVSGVLEITWGDSPDGRATRLVHLTDPDTGARVELVIAAQVEQAFGETHGELYRYVGRRMTAQGSQALAASGGEAVAVAALAPVASADPQGRFGVAAVTGPRPWVSILCKFAGNTSEPKTVAYHQNLLMSSYPGMDHYWLQVSYDLVTVSGSQVAGWFTLPQPRSYYVYDRNGDGTPDLDHTRAANDCTAVADASVYFPSFSGINLMFNDNLDCCAWGGGRYMTLDGQSKYYSMTWQPPWGQTQSVMGHEMGHGFGLPHSASQYPGGTYGSGWDVMSGGTYLRSDPTYGWIGTETISYHRDLLGWIPSGRKYEAGPGTVRTITLERLGDPQSGSGYLMAKIPIRGTSQYFTVEARRKTGDYETSLPGSGVVIHHVQPGRAEPAQVIDHDNNGNAKDAGAALQPGQTWTHASGAQVTVISAGATSHVVRVRDGLAQARPADFTGDGVSEYAVFRASGGEWQISGGAPTAFGLPTDIPVPGDYNGDRIVEIAMFRPSTGEWLRPGQAPVAFGQAGDIPVPADYDGNGTTDLAVYRAGAWLIQGQPTRNLGLAGDVPLPGDYNGDGRADAALYRRATSVWYVEGAAPFTWGAAGDVPVPADYDGDGLVDAAVFRPSTGYWFLRNVATVQWGQAGDVPMALEMDGTNGAELVVYRPATSQWFGYNLTTGGYTSATFGQVGDRPVGLRPGVMPRPAGDRDGDWKADVTVYRPSAGTWYTRQSGGAPSLAVSWGAASDLRVPGDYDGDGRTDYAVFRPSTGAWYALYSSLGHAPGLSRIFGQSGDVPAPGDWDGDGRTDLAVFRPSTGAWYALTSSSGFTTTISRVFGVATDLPVASDYDGDGRFDFVVFRPSTGVWYALLSGGGFTSSTAVSWGATGDVPVPADVDGDGRTDRVVFRPSTGVWYVSYSASGTTTAVSWGANGDEPVAADFDGDGRADLAAFRASSGQWFVRTVAAPLWTVTWGTSGDLAAVR